MNYDFTPEEKELRSTLRQLLKDELPEKFPGIFVKEEWPLEASKHFCRVLAERSLLTQAWPAQYGGLDASLWAQAVLKEEMWAHDEPRGSQYMNLNWIGPAIMRFGTPEQRERHLPPIARGEALWCQGFSEPDAGSDLGSLRLRAERDGDEFILNGQKIWTSYADFSEWCFLAARTSTEASKQQGITVFLIPLRLPGVTVRPIDAMLGPRHLNEVFFDNVRVSADDILGGIGNGWGVITAALTFERVGIARYARSAHILAQVSELLDPAEIYGAEASRFAAAVVHTKVAQLLTYRAVASSTEGDLPLLEAPLARISGTLLEQEVAQLAMDLVGESALLNYLDPEAPLDGHLEHHWRYSQSATVAAGTIEVQKKLVSRQILG